jgi:hypothetical protein
VRAAEQIRLDIGATAQEILEAEMRVVELRHRLGRALAEARGHPELTLEEARQIPEKPIPRQTAYELAQAGSRTPG